ncbi:hypothetical protein CDAR_379971 [Caerostris darwini]|uniref:Uncharacterized protein n=1 Tax=Caerostris darwini TaxID=1538125 RepID=A0AAV4MPL1_9ARAC|nr:hypothetical protein CDAR_379971 [Caerostris darwini]
MTALVHKHFYTRFTENRSKAKVRHLPSKNITLRTGPVTKTFELLSALIVTSFPTGAIIAAQILDVSSAEGDSRVHYYLAGYNIPSTSFYLHLSVLNNTHKEA